MKNSSSWDKLSIGFNAAYILLLLSFVAAAFLYSEDWIIRGGAIVFALLLLLLAIAFMRLLRKQLVTFSASLADCIDHMINGKKDISFELEDETLRSKLGYRLRRLYEIMQRSSGQIQSEKEMMQEIISDISHQVKTPLTNLKIYNSTLLERQLPQEKEREFHLLMENQINKLEFLMQSMVNMSRLETGLITLTVQPSPVYDTIALSLSGIVLPAEQKNIEITVDCSPLITVPHDKKWTAEALFNILDNAVKYTGQGGKITIKAERWETMTRIDIVDTGKGIPEQHYAQIFKRFYREEDVHDVDGVGIGLYLCREIISHQRGYLQVKSEPGKGSVFSVLLPNE